jgi:hypothetical protein
VVEIDETPDSTRPRNVWPRLLAFGLVVVIGIGAVIACIASFAGSVPHRQLTVAADRLEPGQPLLLPVTTWGADPAGHTFGAWVVILPDGSGVRAYLSRDPSSGCQVQWKVVVTDGVAQGAFVDQCHPEIRYDVNGAPAPGAAVIRALDHFDVRVLNGKVIVPIEQVQLGDCAAGATPQTACSAPGGAPRFQGLPAGPLAGIEGYRQQ